MSVNDEKQRFALITGGARGIGFGIAERLLQEGIAVMLWDIDAASLAAAEAGLAARGDIRSNVIDITDPAAIEYAVVDMETSFGPVDILVHSAGILGPSAPVVEYPLDDWRRVIEVDLNGTFYVNRSVVSRMIARNYGRVVNVASVAGKEGNPNAAAYSAAKAGVIGLTKSLGKETAHLNIAINCVTPAVVNTRLLEQVSQQMIDYMLSKIPRARFLEIEEIAAMVAWLVSEENSFATGGVFDISGGRATY